jgi:uncharacterized repeat protein (TIGR01451 family)
MSRIAPLLASLLCITSLCFAPVASSQVATLDFAAGFGSATADYANGVAIDSGGNIIVAGQFTGTVDFDPGAGVANLASTGNVDAFVAKYSATGAFVWAVAYGTSNFDYAYAVAVDTSDDSIYIAGQYAGASAEAFVRKYDSAGTHSWTYMPVNAGNDRARAVAVVGTDVYVAGEIAVSGQSQNVFLWKLPTAGAVPAWTRTVGGTGSDVAYGVAPNAGGTEVYVTGQFSASVDFDPTAGTDTRASLGSTDAFVWNIHSDGSYGFTAAAGSTGGDVGFGIDVDGGGNLISTGYFNGTVDFDPGAGTASIVSAGGTDLYVQKLTSVSAFVWVQSVGGTSADSGNSIAIDASNNVFVTGFSAAVAGACPLSITSAGQSDIILGKWLADGSLVSLNGMGGTNFDDGRGIATSGSTAIVVGSFQDTADFDPGPATVNLTAVAAAQRDFFVARYSAFPSRVSAAEVDLLQGVTSITDGTLTAVDFGSTPVGVPVSLTFTIDNSAGSAPLSLANLTLDGNPLPFGGYSNPGGFPASVAAGGTDTFDLQLDATGIGTFGGTISFDNNDCNEDPYTFPITGMVAAAADVSITKTLMTAGPYSVGQAISYDLIVTNAGPSAATGVQVTDTPTNLTITTVSSVNCAALPCTIPGLAAATSETITVTATISAVGAFDNSATAAAAEADPDSTDNTDNTGNGSAVAASADVSITKTLVTAGPYSQGQSVTYTLVAANVGPAAASNVQVSDTPTNLTIVNVSSVSCAALPCTIPNLAAAASETITVSATISAAGPFDNSATVTATEADPDSTNNTDAAGNGGLAGAPIPALSGWALLITGLMLGFVGLWAMRFRS